MMSRSLFVYGTLMAPEVVETLVGRLPPSRTAWLSGFSRHPVVKCVYPGIIPLSQQEATAATATVARPSKVQGILFTELTDEELEIMDWFEDVEYTRTNVNVIVKEEGNDSNKETLIPTQVYVWTNPLQQLHLSQTWDYERFRAQNLADYLVRTVQPCLTEFQTHKANNKP